MGAQRMNAAVLHGIGRTPRCEPFPAPVAGGGEAVVTVAAAALKPSDRFMANGVHYAPAAFPQVAGLDGVGRLPDGTRVAFFIPQQPYGGMAEQALVRAGMWLPVPDGVDDVTAAAFLNPGLAAWKALVWEGELAVGPGGARARRDRHVGPDRRAARRAPGRARRRGRAQPAGP